MLLSHTYQSIWQHFLTYWTLVVLNNLKIKSVNNLYHYHIGDQTIILCLTLYKYCIDTSYTLEIDIEMTNIYKFFKLYLVPTYLFNIFLDSTKAMFKYFFKEQECANEYSWIIQRHTSNTSSKKVSIGNVWISLLKVFAIQTT